MWKLTGHLNEPLAWWSEVDFGHRHAVVGDHDGSAAQRQGGEGGDWGSHGEDGGDHDGARGLLDLVAAREGAGVGSDHLGEAQQTMGVVLD